MLAAHRRPLDVVASIADELGRESARHQAARHARECHSAASTVRWQIVWFTSLCISKLHRYVWTRGLLARLFGSSSMFNLAWLASALDDLICILAILQFGGAFSGSLAAARLRESRKWRRRNQWIRAGREFDKAEHNRHPARQSKVCELCERGFTLAALLHFYQGLGSEYMLHWEPTRHTTADVVRHAIIPVSAGSRSAMATLMMEGVPTRPPTMVTHNWDNLFRNLVAAVIAYALDEAEYAFVSHLLETDAGIGELEGWLLEAGQLDSTYWVCAFSVNQHATICGGNPHGAKDSVTGELYPL